jgi:hypothetical protein
VNELIDRRTYPNYSIPKLRFSTRNSQRPAEIAKEFERVNEWLYHRGDDPRKAGISEDNIVKYRSVLESISNARAWLNAKAREEKLVKVGGIQVGSAQWDKKKFALNIIAASKRLDRFDVPKVIHQAATQNDIAFSKRLAGCLKRKTLRAEVDWMRVDVMSCFIVDFWVGHPVHPIPPLCLFSNQALMDFCSLALGAEAVQSKDAFRQWICRLQLNRWKPPLIRECKSLQTGEIKFVLTGL